jgi:hypothetical protein
MCSWSPGGSSLIGFHDREGLSICNIRWSVVTHFLLSLGYQLELIILPAAGPLDDCLTCNTWTYSFFPTVWTIT